MRRWTARAPHAARASARRPCSTRRACWCSAVLAPILWTDRGERRSTPATSCRARRPSTGPAPTTSAATSSTACWWRPGSRSSSPWPRPRSASSSACVLGTAPLLLGRRAGPARHRGRQHRGRVPRAAARAVLRGRSSASAPRARCSRSASPARPAFARLTQTLVAGVAGRDYVAAARIAGVGRFRHPGPARPAQHRRAAGRQRHHRRRRRAAGLRRPVLPRPRRPAARATTGAGCSTTASAAIYVNPAAALAPGRRRRSSPGSRSTSSARRSPRASASAPSAASRCRPAPAAREPRTPARADATARPTPTWCSTSATSRSPSRDRPARSARCAASASPSRRGEAVGIVGESGSGKSLTALAVARLVEDPGRVDADRLELLGTDLLGGRTRRRSASCSAPRSRWSSRTR